MEGHFLENVMSNSSNTALSRVLDKVSLVVYQTRIVTPIRDTGEGKKVGSRIEKVLQACFDPAALRPHAAKKQEANRLCRLYGTRVETLNAWAVPTDRTQELMAQLAEIDKEWKQLTNNLASNMKSTVDKWAQANPTDAAVIKELAPTADEVRAATRFIFTSFRLQPDQVSDPGCLELELMGLAGQALHEFTLIIRDASLHHDDRTFFSQAGKDALVKIATKAESLAFLDPILGEVARVLNSTLAIMPQSGQIVDAHAILLKSVIDQLMSPHTLMRVGFKKLAMPQALSPVNAVQLPGVATRKKTGISKQPKAGANAVVPEQSETSVSSAPPSQAYTW